MKKVTISLLSLVFLIGCGSSSSSDTKKDDKTLDFNQTKPAYDLNNYLQTNSVVTYKLSSYIDKTGKKDFEEENKVETFPSQTNKWKADLLTMSNAQNVETGTIKILKNKFERTMKMGDKSIKFDIVRNFNIGEYLANHLIEEKISNATVELNRICKATKTLETKEYNSVTYNDILEIKCDTTSTLKSKNELTTKANVEKSELIYMAKGKGIIYNESESCTSVTNVVLGQESEVKVCKKDIQEIITFNKI